MDRNVIYHASSTLVSIGVTESLLRHALHPQGNISTFVEGKDHIYTHAGVRLWSQTIHQAHLLKRNGNGTSATATQPTTVEAHRGSRVSYISPAKSYGQETLSVNTFKKSLITHWERSSKQTSDDSHGCKY